ncbi:MAG TPA: glycosyltransferase family 4 protein [Stellaceae bacterium]|jgi:glycosyltransferase involved in cell wall biosynthesis|nr:glycosyltransferase family 4 protein [Stellaceae bacterium]
MRIAFYAPLKPPDHPVASGDRTMARLLIAALRRAGHEVDVAATLRSRDGAGDSACQQRVRDIGQRLAARYLRGCAAHPERRPDLWFTYHLYYKAPDWLGPRVADALAIPYVVAEASLAGKRSVGPWAIGHAATLAALRRADAVIGLNSADRDSVLPELAAPAIWHDLPPFLDAAPFAAAAADREAQRETLAAHHGIDRAVPWLVAAAMMREGDKLASYRLLAAALRRNLAMAWHLLVIGDGTARDAVEAEFAPCAGRVAWLGRREGPALAAALAASDLMVWPAINEAYGMALLEGQAAGLPVLAGASGGVAGVVADGITGTLVPPGDVAAFAAALAALLAQPERLRALAAATAQIRAEHDIAAAARRLDAILRDVAGGRRG